MLALINYRAYIEGTLRKRIRDLEEEMDQLIEQVKVQSPAHPAIPEEVREMIRHALDSIPAIEIRMDSAYAKYKSARDWLAKCQEATDKAVCPRCKKSFYPCEETVRYFICSCGQAFNIRVIVESYIPGAVISPPREPKGGGK